jgi:hypothetical protein
MLIKGTHVWRAADTNTALIVAVGLVVVILWSYHKSHGFSDPLVYSFFGVLFIGVPPITLACTIFKEGGHGLAGAAVLSGNVSILIRLALLGFTLAEAGWDRNRKGAAMSEFANEMSWLLVTLAWLISYRGG